MIYAMLLDMNFAIILVLLGSCSRVTIILAHQCYVCGSETNVSCDKFDPTNKSFIKDCPSAKACSIQTSDNSVERSCEDRKIRDCQIANNVQYCYCSENLCNGKIIDFSDDEDLTEGSGGIVVRTSSVNKEEKNLSKTNQSHHIHLYLYSTYIPILILLCN